MIPQALRKRIRALHRKKGREKEGLFLVEGEKAVKEVLSSPLDVTSLVAVESWKAPAGITLDVFRTSEEGMRVLSALRNPSPVLAVVRLPKEPEVDIWHGRWFWLDGVRDPGNLGTIIRLAEWFGLSGVVLSPDCVEPTNPKVVQATMGSLFRLPVVFRDLEALLGQNPDYWCAGTFMGGEALPDVGLPTDGALVLGNEGSGIRPGLRAQLTRKVGIPGGGGAESLNVAMAAAVCAYEWIRS